MPITPPINLAEVGLILDTPDHATSLPAWRDSLNMRARDGSVHGVYSFKDFTDNGVTNQTTWALTQYTPAGTNQLNVVFLTNGASDAGFQVWFRDTTNSMNTTSVQIPLAAGLNSAVPLDAQNPPQVFVFNDIVIINPTSYQPLYLHPVGNTYELRPLPNWFSYEKLGATYPALAKILRPFGNRLVAMNLEDEGGTSAADDDLDFPIDFVWSSNVKTLSSLDSIEWAASTVNTAGDSFLTETPGKILDGGVLGGAFIAYKSDAVIRVTETGDSLVLAFESLFEDDGIYSNNCFINIGNNQHMVLGNYGIYVHNGQSDKQDIGKGVFQNDLFDNVLPALKNRAFMFYNTRDKEAWMCIPTTKGLNAADAATYTGGQLKRPGCTYAYVWDVEENKLHVRELPYISDMFEAELDGKVRILGANANQQKVVELTNDTWESNGFFQINNKVMDNSGSAVRVNGMRVSSDASLRIDVVGKSRLGEDAVFTLKPFDPTTDYKIDLRTTGRYLGLRVQMVETTSPTTTVNPMLTSVALDVTGKQARR